MFHPDWDERCKSCSFWAAGFERAHVHLTHQDVTSVLHLLGLRPRNRSDQPRDQYLDLVPKGRGEDGLPYTMAWVRRRDQHEGRAVAPRRAALSGIATSFGVAMAAAVVPKCPLCVAAMLVALGVGGGTAAGLEPIIRPAVFVVLAAAVVAVVILSVRRGVALPGRVAPPCCTYDASAAARASSRSR